jgi:hypothetical protein
MRFCVCPKKERRYGFELCIYKHHDSNRFRHLYAREYMVG